FSDDIRALAAGLLKSPQSIQVTPPNSTVERIAQVIYPVGRNHKKEVLAHLIESGNISQALVFTRTKYGANQVADYLDKRGIQAMALHGNKSQSARTQALADFKSGALRALAATDIAARGIDIDDLPYVVNYDIPNVPEDYVHRIGRTGRAGASGKAVSLVCLDEEGFMMEIERFTRQQIPVEILESYGPDPDEKAEPVAMGRQTLWGGLGKPPSREVMQTAARAARQAMMERIRENRGNRHAGQGNQYGSPRPASDQARADYGNAASPADSGGAYAQQQPAQEMPQGAPGFNERGPRRNRYLKRSGQRRNLGGGNPQGRPYPPRNDRYGGGNNNAYAPRENAASGGDDDGRDDDLDFLPRHIDPLQTNLNGRKRNNGPRSAYDAGGQPDPTKTSVDLMGGKSGGGRNNNRGGRNNNNRGGGASHAAGTFPSGGKRF
ncbi:MAG: RNA helicase, partial [Burkholderiaceae bacterium]|nr:RNA helicase [Burkholderiaceae bacterium]